MKIPDDLLARLIAHLPPGHLVTPVKPPTTAEIREQIRTGRVDPILFEQWHAAYINEVRAEASELMADELAEPDISRIIAASQEPDPWYATQAAVIGYLYAWAEAFRAGRGLDT
jgi:hypothetical protein